MTTKWKSIPGVLIVLGVAIVVGILVWRIDFRSDVDRFLRWIQAQGAAGPIWFAVAYAIATVLFLPGWILTLGAGYLFGLGKGIVCVSAGSTLGAAAAFLIGRFLSRGWVERKMARYPMFWAGRDAITTEGWKLVLLVRLSPLFPFNLINYAFGVTGIPFRQYFFASWLGMLPGTALYVYLGSLAGSLTELRESGGRGGWLKWGLLGVGWVATFVVVYLISVKAQRLLRGRLEKKTVGGEGR